MVDYQRRQWAKEYVCPLCSSRASFPQEPKLWEHAKHSHMDYLDYKLEGDESQKRKQFSDEAIQNLYVMTTLKDSFSSKHIRIRYLSIAVLTND